MTVNYLNPLHNKSRGLALGPPESFGSCRGLLHQRQGAGAKVTLSTKMLFGYDDTPEGLLEDKT